MCKFRDKSVISQIYTWDQVNVTKLRIYFTYCRVINLTKSLMSFSKNFFSFNIPYNIALPIIRLSNIVSLKGDFRDPLI